MIKNLNLGKSLIYIFIFCLSIVFNELRSEEFFGYETYKPITNYFPSRILREKYDHTETLGGFYTVDITNYLKRNQKSPYFDIYEISIDNNNFIHEVVLRREYKTMETCQKISNTLVNKFTEKYNVIFINADDTYPEFKAQRREANTKDDHRISINCNYYFADDSVEMWSFIATSEVDEAITKFYDKGF